MKQNEQLLPQQFLDNFKADFGEQFLQDYLQCFTKPSVRGLRLNTNNIDAKTFEQICKLDISKIDFFNGAYYLNNSEKLGNTVLHQAGAYYLQEPSSMVPVASVQNLDFNGKLILDLCASPGGKSTQIACLMAENSLLVSNEIDPKRAEVLMQNIERFGTKNVIVLNESPERLAKNMEGVFDIIFVDAPCSGEGMFRKDQVAIDEWNAGLKQFNHLRQLKILESANKMLKTSGTLVYSTCTFNTLENEQTIQDFCKSFEYEIQDVCACVKPFLTNGKVLENNQELLKTKHFFPFKSLGEGQFVAVLKKLEQTSTHAKKFSNSFGAIKTSSAEHKILMQFVNDNLTNLTLENFNIVKIGQKYYLINKNFDYKLFDNLKIKSLGVGMGEIIKNRLQISHQFFKSYGNHFVNYIDINHTSEILKSYIKGEQLYLQNMLNSNDILGYQILHNGYGVIKTNGLVVGGIKIVGDEVKNHYKKSLRLSIN